jgi:hypothetical protein
LIAREKHVMAGTPTLEEMAKRGWIWDEFGRRPTERFRRRIPRWIAANRLKKGRDYVDAKRAGKGPRTARCYRLPALEREARRDKKERVYITSKATRAYRSQALTARWKASKMIAEKGDVLVGLGLAAKIVGVSTASIEKWSNPNGDGCPDLDGVKLTPLRRDGAIPDQRYWPRSQLEELRRIRDKPTNAATNRPASGHQVALPGRDQMTTRQAAARLRVDRKAVNDWLNEGGILTGKPDQEFMTATGPKTGWLVDRASVVALAKEFRRHPTVHMALAVLRRSKKSGSRTRDRGVNGQALPDTPTPPTRNRIGRPPDKKTAEVYAYCYKRWVTGDKLAVIRRDAGRLFGAAAPKEDSTVTMYAKRHAQRNGAPLNRPQYAGRPGV